jgi:hypothetical protein
MLRAILQGGADKLAEAGVVLIGGHSVEDPELTYGLSVTVFVHPARVLVKQNLRPGDRLVFVNNGVKLAVGGSEVLASLQGYEAAGLRILVCGTCLTHFGLLEHRQVEETTTMLDIVTAMQLADKVIGI